MKDVEQTIGSIIDKQTTCFISSVDHEGFPNTKAMLQPRKRYGIRELYFHTKASSRKVESFVNNPKACLYFCDKRFYKGAMLKGTVEVLKDQKIRNQIWRTGDRFYYPKGKTDPNYCILKFTAISGRYYHNLVSKDFVI